jgi:hypothetical protein
MDRRLTGCVGAPGRKRRSPSRMINYRFALFFLRACKYCPGGHDAFRVASSHNSPSRDTVTSNQFTPTGPILHECAESAWYRIVPTVLLRQTHAHPSKPSALLLLHTSHSPTDQAASCPASYLLALPQPTQGSHEACARGICRIPVSLFETVGSFHSGAGVILGEPAKRRPKNR